MTTRLLCTVATLGALSGLLQSLISQAQTAVESWTLAATAAQIEARRGNFGQARVILEESLKHCGQSKNALECRSTIASSLGDVLRAQARVDRTHRDTLLRQAAAFYDLVLHDSPEEPQALYNKALTYRAIGAHEWQESFFRTAPDRAGSAKGVFLSFLGDYFSAHRRWSEAEQAYRDALDVNPDDPGAQGGLVQALRALGTPSMSQLLTLAAEWELRNPSSAADAYSNALALASSTAGLDPHADAAMLGLVTVQARSGRALGEMPPEVPREWQACQQLSAFLDRPDVDQLWWWRATPDRASTLALAALARGREWLSRGRADLAEQFWRAGVRVAVPPAGVYVDLQRELAMLFFRHPNLDLDGSRFARLEREMFAEKAMVLPGHDLEAAQRFHTALGLIYAARGAWQTQPARNALDQLTWALAKSRERVVRDTFYQPLAHLHALLAQGLDSIGSREQATRAYVEAAAAYFDLDDFQAAISSLRAAGVVAETWPGSRRDSAWAFRYSRSAAGELPDQCGAGAPQVWISSAAAIGDPFRTVGFRMRQRFKILADCAQASPTLQEVALSLEAFRLVERGSLTLVGINDVRRFERIIRAILEPVDMDVGQTHFDRARPNEFAVRVALPGETSPLWLTVRPSDLIGARVMSAIGNRARVTRLRVAGNLVELHVPAGLPNSIVSQLRSLEGVREVRVLVQSDALD